MRHVMLLIALALACSNGTGPAESSAPCGIVPCGVGSDDAIPDYDGDPEAELGKFDRAGVEDTLAVLAGDGVLDADDVREAFDAAGNRVGKGEMEAIRVALAETTIYEVTDEAKTTALDLAYVANLFDIEREHLDAGLTYAGTNVPAAVREVVARARLHGAVAYDVRDTNDDGESVWNPYPSTTPPVENMTFEHTFVSPTRLAEDLAATDLVYAAISGTESAEHCDGGTCQTYQRVRYDERVGGTGNVLSQYDEVYHPDIYARGSQGQIWANNCAILSDGSLHCLPASRRSVIQDVILTNPHLSRCNPYQGFEDSCRHLLYHGHIDVRAGVVVGVEMSGRISKRAARGKAIFIDPIAVLEAWGFEIAPGVSIRYGNTEDGTPIRDLEGSVLREAD